MDISKAICYLPVLFLIRQIIHLVWHQFQDMLQFSAASLLKLGDILGRKGGKTEVKDIPN